MTITRWTITPPPADGRHENWEVNQEYLLTPDSAWELAASLNADGLYNCARPYKRLAQESTCTWDWVCSTHYPTVFPFLSPKAKAKFNHQKQVQVIYTCEY